jgi:isocitrate dehydrogenase
MLETATVLHEHKVEKGDIWRSATAKKAPIEDWVKLAIDRQKATGCRRSSGSMKPRP